MAFTCTGSRTRGAAEGREADRWHRPGALPHTPGVPRARLGSSSSAAAIGLASLATFVASCGEARGTLVTTLDGGASSWRPAPGSSWQVQLTGPLDTSIDVAIYDIDLFDTPVATFDALQAAGRRVICYVSVGTHEPWRADASSFPPSAVGSPLAGYPDESWLDTRDAMVRALMAARLDVAAQKGCDGVDLSSISPGGADTGFSLTRADALSYGRTLAGEAHARGLAVGLGGGSDIAAEAQPDFDWAFADTCLSAGTCGAFSSFVAAHKTVFAVEFGTEADVPTVCPPARQAGLDALIKNRALDAFRVPCP
jgi:hypothetical protein